MSARANLNHESFQKVLADALAVQESGIDAQSLLSLVQLERSVAMGEANVDQVLQLIADVVRKVANATGAAIALFEADQLVYRATSGIAAINIRRPVRAVLNVSADKKGRYEILRVEDAETDKRIEGDICRQFGARSLLILPIHRRGGVVGVLEVTFGDAHTFREREVHAYRLMACLVTERVFGNIPLDYEAIPTMQPTTVARQTAGKVQSTSTNHAWRVPVIAHAIDENSGALVQRTGELSGMLPSTTLLGGLQSVKSAIVKEFLLNVARWKVAMATVVMTVLVAIGLSYHHRSAAPVEDSLSKPNLAARQALLEAGKPTPHMAVKSKVIRAARLTTRAHNSKIHRIHASHDRIDYIGDDVTIRHFLSQPPPQGLSEHKHVSFGGDVTVRYFSYNQASTSQTEAPPSIRPAEPSLPAPK